jgi:hypothetical protein
VDTQPTTGTRQPLQRAGVSTGKRSRTQPVAAISASPALEENVQAIKAWERAILLARSKAEQINDWIACTAASGPVLLLHVLWFGM